MEELIQQAVHNRQHSAILETSKPVQMNCTYKFEVTLSMTNTTFAQRLLLKPTTDCA